MFVALDPRASQEATMSPALVGLAGLFADFHVPPMSSSITVSQTSTSPASFELIAPGGNPVITPEGNTPYVTASTSPDAPSLQFQPPTPLTSGTWTVATDLIGPFTKPSLPKGTKDTVSITTRAFDPTVTSNVYDVAKIETLGTSRKAFFGHYVPAGTTARLAVAIRPNASSGTVVQGTLLVEDVDEETGTLSLLAELPYEYVAP
jgi:hypothetical protein